MIKLWILVEELFIPEKGIISEETHTVQRPCLFRNYVVVTWQGVVSRESSSYIYISLK